MSGIDGIKGRFAQALQNTKTTGTPLDKATLDQAVSEAALDDGVVDGFEKQEIANQWAKFKPGQVSPDAQKEYGRLQQAWGLPQASAVTPLSWSSKPTPFDKASNLLLLTDGRVLAQDEGTKKFWLLTPDKTGSYANGTWAPAADANKGRLYHSSAVLDDGRVLMVGGEYIDSMPTEDPTAEIYDPAKNTWSPIDGPGWAMVGDAPSAVLPDGRVLFGSLADDKTAIFDPKTNKWSDGGTKLAPAAEESWVLMRDGSVLTVDCSPNRAAKAELWTPDGKGGGSWADAGQIPVELVQASSEEIGPGVLLNDGRALYVGATGHTAIYTPAQEAGKPGTWTAGPDFPKDDKGNLLAAKDAPGALLTNGHVLLTASALGGEDDGFGGPTRYFDFDPATNNLAEVDAPPNAGEPPYKGRMLMLPTGEIAYTHASKELAFASMGSAQVSSPAPAISSAPASALAGDTITVQGTQFNGVSQDIGYGDDAAAATNYPLARLLFADGSMQYVKTHDHSTMGIATGGTTVSTQVDLPTGLPPGDYQLQLVTNGVPSNTVPLTIRPRPPPPPPPPDPGTTGTAASGRAGTNAGASSTAGAAGTSSTTATSGATDAGGASSASGTSGTTGATAASSSSTDATHR